MGDYGFKGAGEFGGRDENFNCQPDPVYHVTYNVDCGISHGTGHKVPYNYDLQRDFWLRPKEEDKDHHEAWVKALKLGAEIAGDHLSNPETKKTLVKIVSMDFRGGELDLSKKPNVAIYDSQIAKFLRIMNGKE